MRINWRARLEKNPSLWEFANWPTVDPLGLPKAKRRHYLRNLRIVNRVLSHVPIKDVEAEYQFRSGRVTHLMNRCLGGDPEAPPALTKALIPGHRISSGHRKAPLPSLTRPAGGNYAFQHLLTVAPGLKKYLDEALQQFSTRSRTSEVLTVKAFHKRAIDFLRERDWPTELYPFTVDNLGYQGARRYFHRRWQELQMPSAPKKTVIPTARPIGIFEEIEIDEHTVDAESSIEVHLNGRWEPLRVSRVSLITCVDVATAATLGRLLVLSRSVSADDVLQLLSSLGQVWLSRPLGTPGLNWPEEPYMPSQIGDAFRRATYGVFKLDNALAHLASDVRHQICARWGATLNLGFPRHPIARALVESTFKILNLTVHRLPSSTGSHPTDPLKEPAQHRKQAPVVSLKTLEEMIDVDIAYRNTVLLGNLGAQSPIHVMQTQMRQHLVPLRPHCTLSRSDPCVCRKVLTVHSEKGALRDPWVNFWEVRYSARGVLPAHLIGQMIEVEYNVNAITTLKAYTLDGDQLGILYASKSWLRFEHSLKTRKEINRLVKREKIRRSDPFGKYFDYLLAHRQLPSSALELVRIAREFNKVRPRDTKKVAVSKAPRQVGPKTARSSSHGIPNWNLQFLERGGTKNE